MPYVVAALATLGAVGVRWALDPWLGDTLSLVTLFPAIALSVWFGGVRPALASMTLGYLLCAYLFIDSRGSLGLNTPQNLIGFAAYLVSSSIIIGFGARLRSAGREAQQRAETLRVTLKSIGDGVIATDPAGLVTDLNQTAESLTGWSRSEAIGRPLDVVFRIVNHVTRAAVENPAQRALREGAVVGLANHTVLIRRDGGERAIDDSAAPIRADDGSVIGCVLVFRDVGERRANEQSSAEQLSAAGLLAAIVTSSDDAIVSKSKQGIIQTWNASAERLFGYSAAEAVGQPISLIVPPERLNEERWIMAELAAGRRVDHFDTIRRTRDGQMVDVSVTISPLTDATGQFAGASKIARDIGAQKQQEKRIRELMDELKAADQRKDQFLATLAHELRGPLAPLKNALTLMTRAAGDPQILAQATGTMDRQLSQMARLVDDLLDVGRITQDRLELRKQPVDIARVVDQAVEAARPLADHGRVNLRCTPPEESVMVDGDPARLTQVVGNLLHNACKYTNHGGHVLLSVQREGPHVAIRVADDGVGIDADVLPRVFDLFVQGDDVVDRAQGGLGIGLTLVKRLVEMHLGTVEVASAGPGLGSTFTVRLPVSPDVGPRQPDAAESPVTYPVRRFLVVDDNIDGAETLTLLLTLTGNEARMVHDGPQAVATARDYQPDVVLLDLGLPTLNGFDVCRRIRSEPWGQAMTMVALTGWGQAEDKQKSKDAGFDAHVVKPVDHQALMALLASIAPR